MLSIDTPEVGQLVSHQGSGGNIIDQTLPIFFLDSPVYK